MQISTLIFKIVMAFLSLSIATDAMKKVSELKVEKGWTNMFHNFTIALIGMVYLFFILLVMK